MFELHHAGSVVEVHVVGEFPREEGLRACTEAAAMPDIVGVLFDLREMTNVPALGRGPRLADELPHLLPRRRIAFIARPGTALYGVVRQITILTKAEMRLFNDRHVALAWLMEASGPKTSSS